MLHGFRIPALSGLSRLPTRLLIAAFTLLLYSGQVAAQGITVWTALEGESLAWLRGQTESYTDAFGVAVAIEEIPLGQLRERALVEAPEGSAADLFVGVPHTELRTLALEGVLTDMTSFATSAYLADLSAPARAAFSRGGRLVGLPLWVEGPALIVNRELVEELPATYGDLLALATELSGEGTYGFHFDAENLYYSYTWLGSYGGYVFGRGDEDEPDPADVGLATQGAAAGALALRDLRHRHDLLPLGVGLDETATLFIEGRLAMTFDGPWMAAAYLNAGLDVSAHPLPPREDEAPWSGFMGATGVLVNAFSQERVDAVNLAKWLVRSEGQVTLARQAFRIPASTSAAANGGDPVLAGFADALQHAEPLPDHPALGRVWSPMGRALTTILASPASDVAGELQRAVRSIVSD